MQNGRFGQENVVELDRVSFGYDGGVVIRQVSLAIRQGDFAGVLGPNGAGKSTLIRLLLGLAPAAEGSVRLFGRDVARFSEWHRVGYVPQKIAAFSIQFPATVQEFVSTGRLAHKRFGRLNRQDWEAVEWAIAAVGLQGFEGRLIHQLSGGQQQRVAVARALAGRPELLVMDEPMAGIDSETREQLYDLFAALNAQDGMTIAMVSHDVAATLARVNAVAYLQSGSLFVGTPQEFCARFPSLACHIDPSLHLGKGVATEVQGVPANASS